MNFRNKAKVTVMLAMSMLLILGCGIGSVFNPAPTATATPAPTSTYLPIPTREPTSTPLPSSTPAATSTLAPTATSAPTTASTSGTQSILFQDTFDSNANGWEIGKYSDDSSDQDNEIVDGKFQVSLAAKQDYAFAILSIPDFSAKDFLLSMDVTLVDTTAASGDFNFGFTLREADGVNGRRYEFTFFNDNTYTVRVWVSSDYQTIKKLATGNMGTAKLEKGKTNNFAIEAKGTSFTFSINGKQLGTFTDTTIDEAGSVSIWLGLDRQGESMTIQFDNLMIKKE
jgi:hypothetical protein